MFNSSAILKLPGFFIFLLPFIQSVLGLTKKKNIIYMRKTVHLCFTQHDIRLQQLDHVYLRHLWTEYRSILSANMLTDSGPTY